MLTLSYAREQIQGFPTSIAEDLDAHSNCAQLIWSMDVRIFNNVMYKILSNV